MKSLRHWQLALTSLVALSAASVMAQNQGRAQAFSTGGDSPNDPTYLLSAESVQKELKLTDSQKASIQKLRDEESGKSPFPGGLMGRSQSDIQKLLDQHATENRERASKILTPEQLTRLNEINIQVAGVTALGFEDVATKLGLDDAQKANLANLSNATRRKLNELNAANNGRPFNSNQKAAREEYKQKFNKITAERKTEALAVLTEQQIAEFNKLQGEKFDTSKIQANRRSFSNRGRIEAPTRPPRSTQQGTKSGSNKSAAPI